ncbi:DUF418 domain-containing protein [Lysinibacillus pakistanensis]|uniref:DUF418 domain-containing protein n=1 Tax=Lysinibacillus pakistanensis TaxID=759811 RepID=A0AAX3WXT4_9BACI|nr:DUF418 domain-containing protein [Lysinibacillus pakistanensis]MDM5231875.1 DUF418 domain-containing protein [Lysinibacillus pakistanensis]WHY47410.1 DUF418 domain-containing protein [Lysinibacillus pakistanensis]WHY52419.1 DUF418 domain-containing protein [Lysinibacillus pakistanensis]
MDFKPTMLQERIATLDILRGISLLGILLVNMFAFYLPMPYIDLASWFTTPSDIVWQQNLDIYVQSSFYPLFAMLFGYGLAMQWQKALSRQQNFYKIGLRRLIVLFVFGLLHALLIWWGDILMMYAFCGVFLLLLLRLQSVWLVTISAIIFGVFQAFMLLVVGFIHFDTKVDEYLDITSVEKAITAYGTGNWADAFMQRLTDLSIQMSIGMWFVSLFTILPYMLLGAAASKWRLVERARELKWLWIALAIGGLVIGIFVKSLPVMFTRTYLFDYLKVYIGGPILSIGYIGLIVLLCLLPVVPKLLSPFAKIGRMSLTMYILQSIIGTILFYQFGFGWYGKVSVATGVFIALGIIIVQMILAEIWLTKWRQGPLEAIWRKLTYKIKLNES